MVTPMKFWWERRSGMWWTFDPSPQRSYYKFLRAVYGMEAGAAWARMKDAFK